MSPSPSALVKLLEKRSDCIQALANDPQSKRALVETLNIPRSTLDDIVRELEHADLAEYNEGQWQLTVLGQSTLSIHSEYKNRISSLAQAAPIIQELPNDTPVNCQFLADADVYSAPATVPDEVIQLFLNDVESASRIRGFTPIVMAGYTRTFYGNATSGNNYQVELILPKEVFERIIELFPEETNEAMADDHITLYDGEVPVTFSLWIADDSHAGIIVYSDHGIRGILKNNTKEALRWATDQYSRIKSNAAPHFYRDGVGNAVGHN